MNAHERKKLRKQKRLVNLGREVAVHIAAAEAGASVAHQQLANRDAALAATLGKARTLEEAVMLARVEATKIQTLRDEQTRLYLTELSTLEDAHKLTLHKVVTELEQKHARELEVLKANGDGDRFALNNVINHLNERIAKLEADAEEPAKLRKRLQESQNKVAALQTEVSQLKKKVVEEVVVKFPRRKRRMEGAEGQ